MRWSVLWLISLLLLAGAPSGASQATSLVELPGTDHWDLQGYVQIHPSSETTKWLGGERFVVVNGTAWSVSYGDGCWINGFSINGSVMARHQIPDCDEAVMVDAWEGHVAVCVPGTPNTIRLMIWDTRTWQPTQAQNWLGFDQPTYPEDAFASCQPGDWDPLTSKLLVPGFVAQGTYSLYHEATTFNLDLRVLERHYVPEADQALAAETAAARPGVYPTSASWQPAGPILVFGIPCSIYVYTLSQFRECQEEVGPSAQTPAMTSGIAWFNSDYNLDMHRGTHLSAPIGPSGDPGTSPILRFGSMGVHEGPGWALLGDDLVYVDGWAIDAFETRSAPTEPLRRVWYGATATPDGPWVPMQRGVAHVSPAGTTFTPGPTGEWMPVDIEGGLAIWVDDSATVGVASTPSPIDTTVTILSDLSDPSGWTRHLSLASEHHFRPEPDGGPTDWPQPFHAGPKAWIQGDQGLVVAADGRAAILKQAEGLSIYGAAPYPGEEVTLDHPQASSMRVRVDDGPWLTGEKNITLQLSPGPHEIEVVVDFVNGRTASGLWTPDVGGKPPDGPPELTFMQRAFAPENQDMTWGVIGLILVLVGALVSLVGRRLGRGRITQGVRELDAIRQHAQDDLWEGLRALQRWHLAKDDKLLHGRLTEDQFRVLESRGTRLLRRLTARALLPVHGQIPASMHQQIMTSLADGFVEEQELGMIRDGLTGLAKPVRERLESLLDAWSVTAGPAPDAPPR